MFWIIVAIWVACGVLAYGLTFAFFQRKFQSLAEIEYFNDFDFASIVGILGPFGLIVALVGVIQNGFYGFKFI